MESFTINLKKVNRYDIKKNDAKSHRSKNSKRF